MNRVYFGTVLVNPQSIPFLLPLTIRQSRCLFSLFQSISGIDNFGPIHRKNNKQGDLDDAREITAVSTYFRENQVEQLFKFFF